MMPSPAPPQVSRMMMKNAAQVACVHAIRAKVDEMQAQGRQVAAEAREQEARGQLRGLQDDIACLEDALSVARADAAQLRVQCELCRAGCQMLVAFAKHEVHSLVRASLGAMIEMWSERASTAAREARLLKHKEELQQQNTQMGQNLTKARDSLKRKALETMMFRSRVNDGDSRLMRWMIAPWRAYQQQQMTLDRCAEKIEQQREHYVNEIRAVEKAKAEVEALLQTARELHQLGGAIAIARKAALGHEVVAASAQAAVRSWSREQKTAELRLWAGAALWRSALITCPLAYPHHMSPRIPLSQLCGGRPSICGQPRNGGWAGWWPWCREPRPCSSSRRPSKPTSRP